MLGKIIVYVFIAAENQLKLNRLYCHTINGGCKELLHS